MEGSRIAHFTKLVKAKMYPSFNLNISVKITRYLPKSFFIFSLAVFCSSALSREHAEDHARHSWGSQPLSEGRPVILYFSSMKDKTENDPIFKSRGLEISELEKCGFDVRDFEVENIEKMGAQLKAGSFPADTPVFISASHGGGKVEKEEAPAGSSSPGNSLMSRTASHAPRKPDKQGDNTLHIDPDGHAIPANELIQSIRGVVPKSSIYLDVCNAGLCRDGKCEGIGTSCADGQTSNAYSGRVAPVAKAMIDLYCDSIKDCKNFEKDVDGKHKPLTGKEINLYMAEKIGTKTTKSSKSKFNDWSEAKREEDKCKALGHKFACSENQSNLQVAFSPQKSDGRWDVATQNVPGVSSRFKPKISVTDIPAENYSRRDFSAVTQALLAQRWPKATDKDASIVIERLVGAKVTDSYQISESGKEIFGTDKGGKPFRYKLNKVWVAEEDSLIECDCVSDDSVARHSEGNKTQEVYFDPSFKLRCRK